ncbi:MAG: ABC transporter ATP-binding protein [Bdellovibrionota bacterium]
MKEPLLLICKNVSYRYSSNNLALDNVSLELERGQKIALLGDNGSGKSTWLKILSTMLVDYQGQVSFHGQSYDQNLSSLRKNLGIVFQKPSLDRKLTTLENLQCFATLFGLPKAEIKQRIEHLIKVFELSDHAHRQTDQLSGGLFRRVEIAKSLLHRPMLLLMDEPSTGLDPNIRKQMWSYLDIMQKQEQLSILFSTHLVDEAQHCDQITLLHKGRQILHGSPEQLLQRLSLPWKAYFQMDSVKPVTDQLDSMGLTYVRNGKSVEVFYKTFSQISPLLENHTHSMSHFETKRRTIEDVYFESTGEALFRGTEQVR